MAYIYTIYAPYMVKKHVPYVWSILHEEAKPLKMFGGTTRDLHGARGTQPPRVQGDSSRNYLSQRISICLASGLYSNIIA